MEREADKSGLKGEPWLVLGPSNQSFLGLSNIPAPFGSSNLSWILQTSEVCFLSYSEKCFYHLKPNRYNCQVQFTVAPRQCFPKAYLNDWYGNSVWLLEMVLSQVLSSLEFAGGAMGEPSSITICFLPSHKMILSWSHNEVLPE